MQIPSGSQVGPEVQHLWHLLGTPMLLVWDHVLGDEAS